MNIKSEALLGLMIGAMILGGALTTHWGSHKQYVINVIPSALPEADWHAATAILETTNGVTMTGPRATLWYAVFDLADKRSSAPYAASYADRAVAKVFAKEPYKERSIVWFSVFKRACEDTSAGYSVDCADQAVNSSFP